jgi:hypothetical protein
MAQRLTEDEARELSAPFPAEAMSQYKKGTSLTSVKASFLIERLHTVFGAGNVEIYNGDVRFGSVDGKPYVEWRGELRIYNRLDGSPRFKFTLIGVRELDGKSRMDYEDTLKSCRTNAISKACFENLLVALDVFKGHPVSAEKAAALDEETSASIAAARMRREMTSWGKENVQSMRGLLGDFFTEKGIAPVPFADLNQPQVSMLYMRWKELLIANG